MSYCHWATVKDAATLALDDIVLERFGTQFVKLRTYIVAAVDTNDRPSCSSYIGSCAPANPVSNSEVIRLCDGDIQRFVRRAPWCTRYAR
jgi:hypothetical protein